MKFTKMHGIGNDYVYVNGSEETVENPGAVAKKVSDRHFGVGSDGLIMILPSDKADVRMRMFNADGSEGEMCGNGIRCVAKYAFDHGLSKNNPLKVETGRGVLTLDLKVDGDKVQQVTVNMGEPILETKLIPAELPCTFGGEKIINAPMTRYIDLPNEQWMERAGLDPRMTCVSTGNPHVVVFCRDVDAVKLEQIGPMLETHRIFPKRINVHFAQVHKTNDVKMRTWERGSGITWACGTGACAVVVAGALTGRLDRKAKVHLPGGDLSIEWRESDNNIYMTGPATEVFSGEWRDEG
jgi:diaminopimelate epimerase